jgi:glycosyltransferase involved in cell wall biosynthesis
MKQAGLAMIANCVTPYRVNLHRLIAEQIPELKLHTLITHGSGDFQWVVNIPASINLTSFGRADDSPLASTLHAPWNEWRKGGRLIHYLHQNNIRAVICNSYRYLSFLRVISHCYRAGIPLLVNTDGNIRSEAPLSPVKAWLKRRTYRWWLKRVTGVMPMGELGDQFFLKYGADPGRFYHLPYVPDYDAFATVQPDQLQRFRTKYGLTKQRRYFLFSGRLVSVKRVDLLIDAFSGLAAIRPEWDVLITGDGVLGPELRRRIPEELQSRLIWTGFLEQDQLSVAYHAADVLVLPSDREPWGLVVQEAMAAGLAVIASDVVGAAHELITDETEGRLFSAGSVQALRDAMLEVSAPARIDEFKQKSRAALAAWRARLDPVSEVRRALIEAGALPNK